MKDFFDIIIQGLIQGLTEFLPVSSSGHLSLAQHFLSTAEETKLFTSIILHLGTLVAVFIAFRKTIFELILEFFRLVSEVFTGKFKWKTMNPQRRLIIMIIISILPLFAFYIFSDIFKSISSDSDIIIEGIAFIYTGTLLLLSSKFMNGKKTAGDLTVKDSLTVGFFQGIALVPGISRSGSTITAGLFSGMKKETAIEYSFILGIPVILAGSFTEFLDVRQSNISFDWGVLAVGFIVAAVAGFFAIKLLKWLVKSDKFKYFGYYTMILGAVVIILGIIEKINGSTIVELLSK